MQCLFVSKASHRCFHLNMDQKEEGGNLIKLHCMIHQQVLFSVQTIQSICSKVLYHSQFLQFLLGNEAEYGDVMCHNNDQWETCTTGIWFFCFFPLRKKIGQFVAEMGQPLHKRKDVVVNQLYVHIRAFETKLQLFQHCMRC